MKVGGSELEAAVVAVVAQKHTDLIRIACFSEELAVAFRRIELARRLRQYFERHVRHRTCVCHPENVEEKSDVIAGQIYF